MDKVQTSLLQCGERRVAVELQGLSDGHPRYPNRSPDFSSMLPLPKPRVPVNSPHLACGAERIMSNSYSLNLLQIVNTALYLMRRKGKSAPLREERRGDAKVESDTTGACRWVPLY